MKFFSWSLLVLNTLVQACPNGEHQETVLAQLRHLAKAEDGNHLIQISPTETLWATEQDIWFLKKNHVKFMDITDYMDDEVVDRVVNTELLNVQYPNNLQFGSMVRPLLKELNMTEMEQNLKKFTSFWNRYYLSEWGKQSSDWLYSKVNEIIKASNAPNASAIQFVHTDPANHAVSKNEDKRIDRKDWGQASIIARIPGKTNTTIIIGAHQDSININGQDAVKLPAPGADDNGSGCMLILEAMRVLLQDPKIRAGEARNTVEFHWYSAEESGLLGSQDIFWKYHEEGRDIRAMFQQDMAGFVKGTLDKKKPEAFGVVNDPILDQVNGPLTSYVKSIIKAYTDIPYVETTCGYACSDHASATKFNFPSAFVIESALDDIAHYIHSENDTIDLISFPHMLQHAKLSLGLAYELAFSELPKAPGSP